MHPLDYRSTALPLELEKTSPRMLNFGYFNPATCLLYDFSNKSIVMLLTFVSGKSKGCNPKWTCNPKAAGSIPAGRQFFHITCFWVVAVLVALP